MTVTELRRELELLEAEGHGDLDTMVYHDWGPLAVCGEATYEPPARTGLVGWVELLAE